MHSRHRSINIIILLFIKYDLYKNYNFVKNLFFNNTFFQIYSFVDTGLMYNITIYNNLQFKSLFMCYLMHNSIIHGFQSIFGENGNRTSLFLAETGMT